MATFTNQASLSYNGVTTNSNIVTGEILAVLSAAKTAVTPDYSGGDRIAYVITLINSGTTAYTGLTITDNLGAYAFGTGTVVPLTYVDGTATYFVNGTLQAAPAVTSGTTLVISGISVPAGGNATVIYEAAVNSFAPLDTGSSITNEAVVSGGGLSENLTVTETVPVKNSSKLTISKALSPAVVNENGTLTYTFVIQNTGNEAVTAADNAVVTDTFDPILNPISVTFNGAPWAVTTNYTYNTATGAFASVAGQITVPAATFTQDTVTGAWITQPGISTLVVTGTV